MAEKWFVGHCRPHVLGATTWYGAYRSQQEAEADVPTVDRYWFKRAGINGPFGYTFVGRDDESDVDYGQLQVDTGDKQARLDPADSVEARDN
ncbi:hypothetical protein [Mycobacteroides abscessus]|uniref:hypothetical protein n=1 Tax=Mycobacteroides abscessus TaxID=36809 RepID=UPI0009279B84|nr:hypothetical protein [Mycobacteroides abscessus]SIC68039.1 Uncharacterised protein [Mycobacteroides abscessus subsp. abscessus]SID38003.1 Uncharacterised protein [Mycobacteroides abscessus subsp. abscessus]SID53722.1 Uncharacterised protein [Mycobacteroides abscessus subsp. abscessus]SKK54551.1 Uncharacterised protein [Mycobacteroides abscessus subsp. abscessus]SKV09871.1 Uncharacterised protein [Mycobacteroides abscessus subsp. abscessus]